MSPVVNPRSAHFDAIADQWDGWDDLVALGKRLDAGLAGFGLGPGETVLDVGCGTGNLTLALARALGKDGRVVAVDISPRMIEVARAKVSDPRVTFHVAEAERLPLPKASCHRVVCFSVWPHFVDRDAVARELARVLRPGGQVHVWHLASRDTINAIHASAGEAVKDDILAPAADTAACLERAGLRAATVIDDAEGYLVTARSRPA
ncbi:MAG: class I SAM-dependent methyltransferase [Deltaproteobacteria bacterium]|nr:class I SAM-dependent methyltransferase [Deltaproteobacteria bacterium]